MSSATPASPAVAEAAGASAPAVTPLTRDGLLAPVPMVTKDVVLPRRGTVRVGEIKQAKKEQIDHLSQVNGKTDYRLYMPRLVAASLVNPDNTPMFPDWDAQAKVLAEQLTPGEINLLFEAAADVNAMTRESREVLGKLSAETLSADS